MDGSSREGLTAVGAEPLHSCLGVEAHGLGGDPQSRLAGRTEPSAIAMCHLCSRRLGLGEMTVTLHADGSVMFRTSSSQWAKCTLLLL